MWRVLLRLRWVYPLDHATTSRVSITSGLLELLIASSCSLRLPVCSCGTLSGVGSAIQSSRVTIAFVADLNLCKTQRIQHPRENLNCIWRRTSKRTEKSSSLEFARESCVAPGFLLYVISCIVGQKQHAQTRRSVGSSVTTSTLQTRR